MRICRQGQDINPGTGSVMPTCLAVVLSLLSTLFFLPSLQTLSSSEPGLAALEYWGVNLASLGGHKEANCHNETF